MYYILSIGSENILEIDTSGHSFYYLLCFTTRYGISVYYFSSLRYIFNGYLFLMLMY